MPNFHYDISIMNFHDEVALKYSAFTFPFACLSTLALFSAYGFNQYFVWAWWAAGQFLNVFLQMRRSSHSYPYFGISFQARWKLATFNGSYLIKSWDAEWNNASIFHPTEVTEWDCYDVVSVTDVTTTCGCSTPAPTAPESTPAPVTPLTPAPATPLNLTSAPTPAPATSMTPGTVMPSNFLSALTPVPSTELTAPAALTAAPVVVDPPPFPLWTVIGGCVGGAALLAIVGVLVAKRRQDRRKNGSGSPPPSDGNAAVVPSVGSRNYPVVSNGGRKNYPTVPGGGGRNYPIVSEFGRANLPVV